MVLPLGADKGPLVAALTDQAGADGTRATPRGTPAPSAAAQLAPSHDLDQVYFASHTQHKMSLLRLAVCRACRKTQFQARRGLATASASARDNRVKLVEVGPRDGLQNEKKTIPLATKIELIERLARTGLDTIEAGSFVSPKWVPQVRGNGFLRLTASCCVANIAVSDGQF